jgi:membrane protease YdiL (CAAX protease family)
VPPRPAFREVIVGLVLLTVVGIGGAFAVMRLDISPVNRGIILTSLSGIGGMTGFAGAYLLRIRSWSAFGVGGTSGRWIRRAVILGIFAFLAKGTAIVAYVHFTGDEGTIQDVYAAGATGGIWTIIATTFFLSVVTPLGEEFLFRGVVTTALLRYGAFCGVVGGALVFAIFHGLNMIFPAALVTGLIAGEVFRRSGSIWPAVIVHLVVNLPTIPVMLLAGAG